MRTLCLALVCLVGLGCGKKSGDKADGAKDKPKPQMPYAMVAANEAALPTCDANAKDRLVYVTDVKLFKTCSGTAWTTVEMGSPTPSVIVSNQLINSIATDYCTQFPGETCRFNGGQYVKFADGNRILTGLWRYYYGTSGGDIDSDSDWNSFTAVIPKDSTSAWQKLGWAARGDGYHDVGVLWESPDTITLRFDTDGNGISSSDPLLDTLSLQ